MTLRLGVATALFALVLPTAAAASVLHGTFRWDAPARLDADVSIGLERSVEARAGLQPTTPAPTVLLESPHARLRLLRWTHAVVAPLDLKGSVGSRLPDPGY